MSLERLDLSCNCIKRIGEDNGEKVIALLTCTFKPSKAILAITVVKVSSISFLCVWCVVSLRRRTLFHLEFLTHSVRILPNICADAHRELGAPNRLAVPGSQGKFGIVAQSMCFASAGA